MNDRELLEMAARAIGKFAVYCVGGWYLTSFPLKDGDTKWNPLEDDGDAFRLAVRLEIAVYPSRGGITAERAGIYADEFRQDKHASARRAIARVAAEIGKTVE